MESLFRDILDNIEKVPPMNFEPNTKIKLCSSEKANLLRNIQVDRRKWNEAWLGKMVSSYNS